ncbi:glycosyltransferase family 2 protein [Flavobacterium sp. ANB]|uniref:glycosyltransferase family 2 protein n=1 Tax=unclassified Flavobacterium TaxID=196869 RepID=UPI0012B74DC0|nr:MULTISPECIES: glycosyltransferase family A protein [unclassified Flavobacterium]MBF4516293.1 glycosyltransferase family 2 protein [Flavobacterium sp. ANB]MTD69810.1 glycosyltransferase [Flavobacterium sp. LC2016-13]
MAFFSIVIPLYNKADYIEDTLKSILNQTFTDYEIIVINDGSTDDSATKVLQFNDNRIQLYNQKNQGASIARNLGIEKAQYDYIAFLDADDLWMPNHLETLNALIQNFPNVGIFASRYELVFKNGKNYIPRFNGISADFEGIITDYFETSLNNPVATSSSIAIPKDVFKQVGYFKPTISSGQDVDMWIRIALKYPVAISNKVTASYLHYIENSLSKTPILDKNLKDFNDYKQQEESNPSLKKYLDIYRIEYALQYKIAGENKKSKELFKNILKENIPFKTKIIYLLPRYILIFLLKLKKLLRKNGFNFSIYQ